MKCQPELLHICQAMLRITHFSPNFRQIAFPICGYETGEVDINSITNSIAFNGGWDSVNGKTSLSYLLLGR